MRRRHRSLSTSLEVGRYRLDTNQSRMSIRTLRNNLLADEGSKWARTELVFNKKKYQYENSNAWLKDILSHLYILKDGLKALSY